MTKKLGFLVASVMALVVAVGSVGSAASLYFGGLAAVRVMLGDQEVRGDVPAVILEGRTMIPLRAVAESLGLDVRWDAATRTVFLAGDAQSEPSVTTRSGLEVSVQDVSPIISAGDEGEVTHADIEATLQVKNTTKAAVDLGQYTVLLRDASGRTSIRGKLVADAGARLEAGASAKARAVFARVPAQSGEMQMILVGPGGEQTELSSITITIECSWPPLRCKITITLDL